jgi:molecular chaperone DnaK
MYQQASQGNAQPGADAGAEGFAGQNTASQDDDVVDADFEEVKDSDKK